MYSPIMARRVMNPHTSAIASRRRDANALKRSRYSAAMWANTIMNAKNISMQAHQAQRILNVSTIMTNTVMSAAQAMILDLRRRFEDAMTIGISALV